MPITPTVIAVCTSAQRGTPKQNITSALFSPDCGITTDAHKGAWHRQVSLLSYDKVKAFQQTGNHPIDHGAFGENLVVEGVDFSALPVGTQLACGDVVLEITQIGKECHSHCQIYHTMGDCIMPREGVFARVVTGGTISVGDHMTQLPTIHRPTRCAVITLSDKGAQGTRTDLSGPLLVSMLEEFGYRVDETLLLPDEQAQLETHLVRLADGRQMDLIFTTGGTGFAPRDRTPEATLAVATRNAFGIAEAIRAHSLTITPRAMLGRGVSVIRNQTLIINLGGSPKAVREGLSYILPTLSHAVELLRGTSGDCATSL